LGSVAHAQQQPVVLQATTVFDGRGNVLHNTRIVVENGKIARVDPIAAPNATPVSYNLSNLTVLPGWIDTHVHITWHFGANGKLAGRNEPPYDSGVAAAGNAYKTLMGGFTTVQSLGSPEDKPLRDAISRGEVPGPRLLTALRPISNGSMTVDQIRDWIRKLKSDGADVVKIF